MEFLISYTKIFCSWLAVYKLNTKGNFIKNLINLQISCNFSLNNLKIKRFGLSGDRTHDLRVISTTLYRLSYTTFVEGLLFYSSFVLLSNAITYFLHSKPQLFLFCILYFFHYFIQNYWWLISSNYLIIISNYYWCSIYT